MEKKETIIDYLRNSINDEKLVEVWNEWCCRNGYDDDRIESNDDWNLDDLFGGMKPSDIISTFTGLGDNYHYNDDWFQFDGYGNPKSIEYLSDVVDFSELADQILEDYSFVEDCDLEDIYNDLYDEFANNYELNEFDVELQELLEEDWEELAERIKKEQEGKDDDEEEEEE